MDAARHTFEVGAGEPADPDIQLQGQQRPADDGPDLDRLDRPVHLDHRGLGLDRSLTPLPPLGRALIARTAQCW